MPVVQRALALLLAAVTAVLLASAAVADSTPVGPLPKGPTQTLRVHPGASLTLSVPRPTSASGKVWRVARPYDPKVVRQVSEGATSKKIWLRYRAVRKGTTTVRLALTRGETRKAYAARSFRIVVR